MDKLEKAKQAALRPGSWHIHDDRSICDRCFNIGVHEGFDAGVAYQGDFTTINSEADLPKVDGDYLWEAKDGSSDCEFFVNGPIDIEFFTREYVAWREIPKYQPDGGEGE